MAVAIVISFEQSFPRSFWMVWNKEIWLSAGTKTFDKIIQTGLQTISLQRYRALEIEHRRKKEQFSITSASRNKLRCLFDYRKNNREVDVTKFNQKVTIGLSLAFDW